MFNLEWKKYKAKKPQYINSLLTEKSHKEQQVSSWHPSINFSITLSCAQTLECISCMCFLWEGVTSAALAYLQYFMSKHFSSKRPAHKNVNPSFSNAHKGAATLFTVSSPHQHPLPPTPTVLNSLEIFKENPQKGAYLELGNTVASWACPLLVLTFTTLYNYTKAFLICLKAQKAIYCSYDLCNTITTVWFVLSIGERKRLVNHWSS